MISAIFSADIYWTACSLEKLDMLSFVYSMTQGLTVIWVFHDSRSIRAFSMASLPGADNASSCLHENDTCKKGNLFAFAPSTKRR